MLCSPRPSDHLDSLIGLNNQENHRKTSRMDSPEPSVDKRPTEEGRKDREPVCATRTGGGAAPKARKSPQSLTCKGRRAGLHEFWHPAGLNIWNFKSQQLCSQRVGRARGRQEGELLSPGRTELSGWTKALVRAISPSHPPNKITKGTCSHQQTCLHSANAQHSLLLIHPSDGSASLLVLQGPSSRGALMAKLAKPAPPAPVHLADPPHLLHHWPDPIETSQQAWQCANSPHRGHTIPQWVLPLGEGKIRYTHTSLAVALAVGWGQTSGLTGAPPTNTSVSGQHRRNVRQFGATAGTTSRNNETEEFSSKETPGSSDS